MIDARRSPELQAAIAAMRNVERTLRSDINATARTQLGPVWQEALRGHVTTRLEARTLLPGARVKVTARQVTLLAGTSKRPLRGGLIPDRDWPSVELGARERRRTVELTSRKGKRYTATRVQGRQFRPRNRDGYVVFPAAGLVGKRLVALYIGIVVEGLKADFEISRGRQ